MTGKYDGFMGFCLVIVSFMQLTTIGRDANFIDMGVFGILFYLGGMFLFSSSSYISEAKKKQMVGWAAFFVIAISLVVITEGIYRQISS